jgi:hypothetical protein
VVDVGRGVGLLAYELAMRHGCAVHHPRGDGVQREQWIQRTEEEAAVRCSAQALVVPADHNRTGVPPFVRDAAEGAASEGGTSTPGCSSCQSWPPRWRAAPPIVRLCSDSAAELMVEAALVCKLPRLVVPCCFFPKLMMPQLVEGRPVSTRALYLSACHSRLPARRCSCCPSRARTPPSSGLPRLPPPSQRRERRRNASWNMHGRREA